MIKPLLNERPPSESPGELSIYGPLKDLIHDLGYDPDHISCDDLQVIADKLSAIVNKETAWSWRYLHQVMGGSMKPSKIMVSAIMALGASTDGLPADLAITHSVQIITAGNIRPGTLIYGDSKPCGNPGCPVWFIPKTWNQEYHSKACKNAVRKLKQKG